MQILFEQNQDKGELPDIAPLRSDKLQIFTFAEIGELPISLHHNN